MNRLTLEAQERKLKETRAADRLRAMLGDKSLNTTTSYSANGVLYPDHEMPFIDKHMSYLMNHPKVNVDHYLANLRLMLKRRG